MPWTPLIFLLPAGLLLYALRQASAPPERSPRRFLARGPRQPGDRVVACVGASITHGRMSADWVEVLARRLRPRGFRFVNAGVNGDLAYNALRRLPEVLRCDPDYVAVLVGTNDVLATLSSAQARRYERWRALP